MIIFWLKESFKLISRAKLSFVLSLISTSIAVMLIAVSLISIELTNEFQTRLRKSVSINVFLDNNISNIGVKSIEKTLKSKLYINSIDYVDKNEAAKKFIEDTGEDFRKLLDYNPLPASFRITFKPSYVEKDSLDKVINSLNKMSGVNEVVFQQGFVYKLIAYLHKIKKYVFIATAVLFFISLYIVYSTVRLIVHAKYEELETMKLVGAKLSTIKTPIILNGILIGLLAGFIALGIFILFIHYLDTYINFRSFMNYYRGYYPVILLLIGPVIGFFISLFSLRNITLKI